MSALPARRALSAAITLPMSLALDAPVSEITESICFWMSASLICAGMGVQNALVTKLSGARIRTTHLTGVTTDIAIEGTKLFDRWRSASRGRPQTR